MYKRFIKPLLITSGVIIVFSCRTNDAAPESQGDTDNPEILAANPNTTFLACHFANCCYDLQILGDLFDQYPNLTADIAARFGEVAPIPRFVRKFYHKYQDRLVYGTDMGMDKEMYQLTFRILESEDEHFYEGFNYHWALNGIGLSTEVLEKIFQRNAQIILNRAKP